MIKYIEFGVKLGIKSLFCHEFSVLILGRLLSLFMPQFPHLQNGKNNG